MLAHEKQDSEQSGEQSNEEERFDTERPSMVGLSNPTGIARKHALMSTHIYTPA